MLAIVTFAVFSPVGGFDFINFDDPDYVSNNPHIASGLDWNTVSWAFQSGYAGNWHPVTWLSHALDMQLFGLNAGRHHLVNVLFHIANSLLLLGVLRGMTGAFWRSAFVAALFALHPLHVESVAWVAERKDVLSTFFFMLTLWSYARYAQARGGRREAMGQVCAHRRWPITYCLALLFFALGLMSKPMLVTLPFVLLLLDFWPLKRVSGAERQVSGGEIGRLGLKSLLIEKIPFFALAIASSVITFLVQDKTGTVAGVSQLSAVLRTENAIVSYFRYIQKMFWPEGLAIFYPHPNIRYPISDQLPVPVVAGIALLLAAIVLVAILRAKKNPWLAVGVFWFFGTLLPVIGLVQVGAQAMADRYSYIPLIGLFIAATWTVHDLFAHAWRGKSSLAALVLVLCAATTRIQVGYWKDSLSVFGHALNHTKFNATAHVNLGEALERKGSLDEALGHYRKTLEIEPAYADAAYDIAHVLAAQNKIEEAIGHYKKVFELEPRHLFARNNLGNLFLSVGRVDEAIAQYREALQINPDSPAAHFNLGKALVSQGNFADAIRHYERALKARPGYAEALTGIGLTFAMQGDFQGALPMLKEVVRLKPDNAEARFNLEMSCSTAGAQMKPASNFNSRSGSDPTMQRRKKKPRGNFCNDRMEMPPSPASPPLHGWNRTTRTRSGN